MSYYSKPQIDLLLKLINESNPGLMEERDLINTRIGVPYNRPPAAGEIADTSLELYATPESFYIGKQIVHYRRIDLSKLFANMTVEVDRWAEGRIRREFIVEQVNLRYGLSLVIEDLPDTTWGETTYNIQIQSTSLVYKGTLRFKYVRGKRALDQILPSVETFQSRVWDSRYAEDKPLLSLVNVGHDYTRYALEAESISNNWTITNRVPNFSLLANWYSQLSGIKLDPTLNHTVEGGVAGLTFTRFVLPNVNAPEGNSVKFNRVLIISSRDDSWFAGKIVMHYNV